jgi:Flp pilus assembly protein TadG
VVEAAILFPIMIIIFAALVLLAMYLPARATLQRATQHAATVIAAEKSDTWLRYDEKAMRYGWETNMDNVYVSLARKILPSQGQDKAETIVNNMENSSLMHPPGTLTVDYGIVNYVIYKESVVTATRTIPMPIDLTSLNFPEVLEIVVTSTAVIQNPDEFIRNIDLIVDALEYFDLDASKIGELFSSVRNVFGKE